MRAKLIDFKYIHTLIQILYRDYWLYDKLGHAAKIEKFDWKSKIDIKHDRYVSMENQNKLFWVKHLFIAYAPGCALFECLLWMRIVCVFCRQQAENNLFSGLVLVCSMLVFSIISQIFPKHFPLEHALTLQKGCSLTFLISKALEQIKKKKKNSSSHCSMCGTYILFYIL